MFGPGLGIAHTGTIIVNPKSRVGSNCRIHSCVYISTHFGCPTIGDNVFIGPGCIISGSIQIGNNVVIGANSYVDSSFQDSCTIAGNPAKIIKDSIREGLFPPQDRVRLNL